MASANKMFRLKYSCEEVYERMDKGLCIFCEELDTPGHHQLKHKGVRIVMTECDDDQVFEDKEEAHRETVTNPNSSVETVTNPEPLVETLKNSGPFIESLKRASVLQVPDSFYDVLLVHKMDSYVKKVEESSQQSTNGNDKIVAHQLFDQMPNEYQKDLTVIESSNKEVLSFSHKDARVWEPGGLPTKMDHWDWFEKEMKPYGESHKVATFLYSQMQVVKSNPAEFKTFDRKRSNKTLPLEDEQDDEHEQCQVMKLISSWKNRIWEPGGVLIEHDRWKEFEKFYKHGRLMRLMQELSSMWWQLSKSRELERFGACSFADIKTWLDLCSREYKNHMLLLDYHGIEMQVLSRLLEIQIKAFTSRGTKEDKSWIAFNKIIDSVKETVVELMQRLGETGLIMKFPSKVKDALDGLVKVGFKNQVCSGFDLETWIGLEVYGWECKKQISIGHISLKGMCNELAYDKDKKKERNIEGDVKNRFLGEGKIILALAVKEYMIGKADEMLLVGDYGLLHTLAQCGGLNATVIAGTIMQSSLKSFHQLRVACLYNTSLGFLYGSLPRPLEENHSNFSNMLQYHETWSCISLGESLFFLKKLLSRPVIVGDVTGLTQNKAVTKALVQWKEHPPDQFYAENNCCYGLHCGLDYNVDIRSAIFMDELSSVCKLLFGAFVLNLIAEQTRDWSFFGLLLQWKWHPPPQATSESHQAHNDKPVFHL